MNRQIGNSMNACNSSHIERIGKKACLSLVFLTTLMITACGFQLRGAVDLPEGVEPIYISGLSSSGQLAIEMRNLLNAYGIGLTKNVDEANYQLVILKQDSGRRTAALGEGARVAEYQLIESVSVELRNEKGVVVFGPSNITERKIMPNDPNKVASTSEEERLLRREMLQRLAAKVARQLQAFDYSKPPQNNSASNS